MPILLVPNFMGKVKSAVIGIEQEDELRDKKKRQREEKKKRESAEKIHISGSKGGEKTKVVGATSEEDIEKMVKLAKESEEMEEGEGKSAAKTSSKEKKPRVRGKRYKEALIKVDHTKTYKMGEALDILRQIHLAKFDESVEVHFNVVEKGLRGQVSLPHGTGKKIKVTIADTTTIDKLVGEIEKGIINFDVLVAHPQVMGKLGKVAKFLGPKGLMPNPKNGTISPTPEKVAEKLKAGEMSWKTESDFPLIHLVIGKLSFKDSQIIENFDALVKAITAIKIQSVTLKSTMSPGIKIQIT